LRGKRGGKGEKKLSLQKETLQVGEYRDASQIQKKRGKRSGNVLDNHSPTGKGPHIE